MASNATYYSYDKVGAWWYVYINEWNDDRTASTGHKLTGDPLEKEEARKEVYRLNGWNYIDKK